MRRLKIRYVGFSQKYTIYTILKGFEAAKTTLIFNKHITRYKVIFS